MCAAAFARLSTSWFLSLGMCITVNPLKCFSMDLTASRFSFISGYRASDSFSMCFVITFESDFMMKFGCPIAFILRRPSSNASYLVVLLVLGFGSLNSRQAAYLNLVSEGDCMTAEMPTPSLHHAPSQYMTHGSMGASCWKVRLVQSAMKSASTCDLIAVLLLKYM